MVRNPNGYGSNFFSPSSPVFQRIQIANQMTWATRNGVEPAIPFSRSTKRSSGDR